MLTPYAIKTKLAGVSFSIKDSVSDTTITLQFPDTFDAWPLRMGSEGIVAPIIFKHPKKGDIQSVIKFFNYDFSVFANRLSFLVQLGLTDIHDWLYKGVPYMWIETSVADHDICGHIAKHVFYNKRSDDFERVRDTDEINSYTEENRRAMAAQLCNAVLGLEKLCITHSDLSPANIVIGRSSEDYARCILVDYDNFHHPQVSRLPRQYNGNPVRKLGSLGYQHPSMMRRIKADDGTDDNLYVENDRFALGVLCVELLTWTAQVSLCLNNLGRTCLIDIHRLEHDGQLEVPAEVKRVWPEGYKLLEKAAYETDVNSLPGPEDWLQALGLLGFGWREFCKGWTTFPFLKVYRRYGNGVPEKIERVCFKNPKGQGNFSRIDKGLSDFFYEYEVFNMICSRFTLKISSPYPVIIKRNGITKQLGTKPDEIIIWPGDQILTDNWILEFQDASLGESW